MMINARLKQLRKEKKVTQIAVARAVDLTERQYQRLESGDSKPMYDTLLDLADFFDVSLDYLTGRSDDPGRG